MRECGWGDAEAMLPSTLGNSSITPSQYLSQMFLPSSLPSPKQGGGPGGIGQSSSFGICTFNLTLTGIDKLACGLSICEDLWRLGQYPLCRSLALTLRVWSGITGNTRGTLNTATVLARLDMHEGKHRDALALLLSAKGGVAISLGESRHDAEGNGDSGSSSVTDPTMISVHASLIMRCYQALGETEAVEEVHANAFPLLKHACALAVPSPRALSHALSHAQNSSTSNVSVSKDHDTSKTKSTTGQGQGQGQGLVNTNLLSEYSAEVVVALVEEVFAYVDVLLSKASPSASLSPSSPVDLKATFYNIEDLLKAVEEFVVNGMGRGSSTHARLLEKRSTACFSLLRLIMTTIQSTAPLSLSSSSAASVHTQWIHDTLSTLIAVTEQALQVRYRRMQFN